MNRQVHQEERQVHKNLGNTEDLHVSRLVPEVFACQQKPEFKNRDKVLKKRRSIRALGRVWSKPQRELYVLFYLQEFIANPLDEYRWQKPKHSRIFKRMERFIPYKNDRQVKNYERDLLQNHKDDEPNFLDLILKLARGMTHNPMIGKMLAIIDERHEGVKRHMKLLEEKIHLCAQLDDQINSLFERVTSHSF